MHTSDVVDALAGLSNRTKRWSPTVVKRELELGRIASVTAFVKDAPCLTLLADAAENRRDARVCRCRRRRGDWHCVVARFARRSTETTAGSG